MKPRLAWVLLVCLWLATPDRSLLAAEENDPQSPEHVPGVGGVGSPRAQPAAQLPEGFVLERLSIAAKPEGGAWTALAVDPQGFLLGCDEAGGIFRMLQGNPGPIQPLKIPFPQGKARGVLSAFGGLYVMASGNGRGIHRLEDADGDGQYDRSTPLHFLPGDGDAGVRRMAVSPDGERLLFGCGPGATLPESLLLRRWPTQSGALGGFICRMNPDGSEPEVVAQGLRAGFDLAFDLGGQLFACEPERNGPGGDQPARLIHGVSGGDYGATAPPGDFPDILPGLLDLGPGNRAGVVSGKGAKFPGRYQRALFAHDGRRLWAVHLQPKGATYLAVKEAFLKCAPLAINDALIHPQDGALYLALGGAPEESGIYRVRYTGETAPEQALPLDEEFQMRAALEQFHREDADPRRVLGGAWPYLRHSDRRLRYAARLAIERLPAELWAEKALTERHPGALVEAVVALARVHGTRSGAAWKNAAPVAPEKAEFQGRLFEALGRLEGMKANAAQQLAAVRAYALVIASLGRPDPAARARIAARLALWRPVEDASADRELAAFLENLRREDAQR